jgi:sensor histidine kinase YesM
MNHRFNNYKLLILLLLADLIFIILHLFYIYTRHLPDLHFSLSFPRGYSEFFQYTKYLWIMVLFLVTGIAASVAWIYFIFSFLIPVFSDRRCLRVP